MDYHSSLFPPLVSSSLSPPLAFAPSFEPFLRASSLAGVSCKKARSFHSRSLSPPPPKDMQSGMGRVVVVGGREGSSMRGGGGGRGNDVTRMVEVGREIKAETFLFPYLFSDRCYQHARVFLHGGWLDGGGGRGGEKRPMQPWKGVRGWSSACRYVNRRSRQVWMCEWKKRNEECIRMFALCFGGCESVKVKRGLRVFLKGIRTIEFLC